MEYENFTEFSPSPKVYLDSEKNTVILMQGREYIRNCFCSTYCGETSKLWPHGEYDYCDCIEVRHPQTFRLKTVLLGYTSNRDRFIAIYIVCEPSINMIFKEYRAWNGSVASFDNTTAPQYVGWTYVISLKIPASAGQRLEFTLTLRKIDIPQLPRRSYNILSDDLQKLLNDETYSDLTISCENDVKIKVHRAILAKRSEVFRAAIEHNQNIGKNEVETHFTKKTMKEIITYIYTDKFPSPEDLTEDLFVAADYYQLLDLKNKCLLVFYKQLSVENAVETLELANRHSCKDLRNFTLRFIKRHFDLVTKTSGWNKLTSTEISKMVAEYIAQDPSHLNEFSRVRDRICSDVLTHLFRHLITLFSHSLIPMLGIGAKKLVVIPSPVPDPVGLPLVVKVLDNLFQSMSGK